MVRGGWACRDNRRMQRRLVGGIGARAAALVAVALVIVAGAAALALLRAQDDGVPRLRTDDERVLARGREVYAAHCAACHGARLEGQPNWRERGADGRLPAPPHDATGHTWHHADEALIRITRLGVAAAANLPGYDSAMPAYQGVLADDDIVAVLSWIKSQWPPQERAWQEAVDRQARTAR